MKVELGRAIGLCLAAALGAALSGACATGEEDPGVFGGNVREDSGSDSSTGAFGGVGGDTSTGGQSGIGGQGGAFGQGGDSGQGGVFGQGGTGPGGTDGTGGAGGDVGGTAGMSGNSGTGGAPSTCNPAFCPNTGMGMPCCTDPPENKCGMNNGSGCQRTD